MKSINTRDTVEREMIDSVTALLQHANKSIYFNPAHTALYAAYVTRISDDEQHITEITAAPRFDTYMRGMYHVFLLSDEQGKTILCPAKYIDMLCCHTHYNLTAIVTIYREPSICPYPCCDDLLISAHAMPLFDAVLARSIFAKEHDKEFIQNHIPGRELEVMNIDLTHEQDTFRVNDVMISL